MTKRLWCALLLVATPATAMAEPLSQTHEQISVPGKAIVAYRPIERRTSPAAKCHPEASKAVACEAQASIARMQALALKRDAAGRLSSR